MCWGTSSGSLLQLCHIGPILALTLLFLITFTCLYCILLRQVYFTTFFVIYLAIYSFWPFGTLYNYLRTVFSGPGFVPLHWHPDNVEHEALLQWCKVCKGFKAPRSHHCRTCHRCVLMMDHHCPWINTCVGYKNRRNFIYFLLTAALGCIHTLCELIPYTYLTMFSHVHKFNFVIFLLAILCTGFCLGLAVALSFMFFLQINSVRYNKTGIEEWIVEKAEQRNNRIFVYPYDLGCKENFKQGFFEPLSDGISWKVRPGCHPFALTIEQIAQKEEKRRTAVQYRVIKKYNGTFFSWHFGKNTFLCQPMLYEQKIALKHIDYHILVTRAKKHWLYGEVIETDEKGWFPSACVIRESYVSCDNVDDDSYEVRLNKDPIKKSC